MQIPNTKASNIKKVKPGWWWFKNKHWDWKRKGNVFKPIGYRGILKRQFFKENLKVVSTLANLRSTCRLSQSPQGFYSKCQDVKYDLNNQKFKYLSLEKCETLKWRVWSTTVSNKTFTQCRPVLRSTALSITALIALEGKRRNDFRVRSLNSAVGNTFFDVVTQTSVRFCLIWISVCMFYPVFLKFFVLKQL